MRLQAWGHSITLTKSFATKKTLPLFVASHISQQTLRQRHLQSHQVLFVARVSLTLSMVLTGLHNEKKVTRLQEVIWCLSIQFYSKTAKTAKRLKWLKWLKYFWWISVLSKGTECVSALPGAGFSTADNYLLCQITCWLNWKGVIPSHFESFDLKQSSQESRELRCWLAQQHWLRFPPPASCTLHSVFARARRKYSNSKECNQQQLPQLPRPPDSEPGEKTWGLNWNPQPTHHLSLSPLQSSSDAYISVVGNIYAPSRKIGRGKTKDQEWHKHLTRRWEDKTMMVPNKWERHTNNRQIYIKILVTKPHQDMAPNNPWAASLLQSSLRAQQRWLADRVLGHIS